MTVPLRAALYLRVSTARQPSTMSPFPTSARRAKPIPPRAATNWPKPMWRPGCQRPTTAAPNSSA